MYAADSITNADILKDNDLQPNGIDIRINKLYRLSEHDSAALLESIRSIPTPHPVTPWAQHNIWGQNVFELWPGVWEFETELKVKVPDNFIGIIHQRSTLSRAGVLVTSGIYDSGYEGLIAGQIHTPRRLFLEKGVRIAQFILLPATSRGRYSGVYQNKTTSDVVSANAYNSNNITTNT